MTSMVTLHQEAESRGQLRVQYCNKTITHHSKHLGNQQGSEEIGKLSSKTFSKVSISERM